MLVPGTLHGTAFGDRYFNLTGKGFAIDEVYCYIILKRNNLIWEGVFNPGKSSHFGKKATPCDFF